MAITHFSAVEAATITATAGVVLPVTVTASLPAAASTPVGTLYVITDNGVGDNETAVVVNNGTAWTLTTGAALS